VVTKFNYQTTELE